MRAALVALALVGSVLPAAAIEAGDVISFSSAGVSETVSAVSRTAPDTYSVVSKAMASNASEYCTRYEQTPLGSKEAQNCIRENTASEPTRFFLNCRTVTLTLQSGDGSGSYRPGPNGDPWHSTADSNLIIRADDIFRKVCIFR